ncbi:MAG: patatin-like phospholipase family protein [Gammaproteobacteria bacterium]|nr:patatin-like phospholipase family protein [Gammaproteobacteria bacterium]MBU2058018.1 patatin-like phospholipase family protein [Gammaproteobacteria bacterium]MBU2174370.1 patatin-like phospholipase family protein [Gammaproteobacteria bacterium]MBU2247566.1 patatin-like phospholipase family protein [Gammaproteobacteria bacterium]MBU2346071.1 patatin-like phospholipase family protein [Gammaproteobacteria bacterium]
MTKSTLRVLAGATAFEHLQQHGLRQQDIHLVLGASGGPKWFCLFGLDQYLFGEFFKERSTPLSLVGSSAGAWRFACVTQQNPAAASERFAKAYSSLCFPPEASIDQITSTSAAVLDQVFPTEDCILHVLNNPVLQLNFIAAREVKVRKSERKTAQLRRLLLAAGANLLKPALLQKFYQRVVMQNHSNTGLLQQVPHEAYPLTPDNFKSSLLASGSIPLVMHPVKDPVGLPKGLYMDGGLLDYHLPLPYQQDGLILYPHFYPYLIPGWFDKSLPWRRAKAAQMDKMILLCPSESWVKSLPYGKIPDRKDFNKLTDAQRLEYWATVLERSKELANDLRSGHYKVERLS